MFSRHHLKTMCPTSDTLSTAIRKARAAPCIPPRMNRTEQVRYDRHLYREPNVIEQFFGRVKQCRQVATRYDKKAQNFLGRVWVATLGILLA